MDKFIHTREYYAKLVAEKQQELLRISRNSIYNEICESIKNSNGDILIMFDSRLDNNNRKILIRELLERFKSLNLIKNTSNHLQKGTAEFCISDDDEIIDDITGIRIVL